MMPAVSSLAPTWKSDVWGAGHMGSDYEPVNGSELPGGLPPGRNAGYRLQERAEMRRQCDRLASGR